MSSNRSVESPIISTEQPPTHSNSTVELPVINVSPSEPTDPTRTRLTISPTGASLSNPILMPSADRSSPTHVTPSVTPSSNLKSHAKPHEIQESLPVEPRILRVSKEDIDALCQLIEEFKEQCGAF